MSYWSTKDSIFFFLAIALPSIRSLHRTKAGVLASLTGINDEQMSPIAGFLAITHDGFDK
jgi:hypothetical protein